MTKCEEIQFDLPLYPDGSLDTAERAVVDAHLPECPLCRQKLSEFEELSSGLRSVPRFSVPVELVNSIRAAVADQLVAPSGYPTFQLIDRRRSWKEIWLVPSTAAAMATVTIGLTLLSFMLTSSPVPLSVRDASSRSSTAPVFLTGMSNPDMSPGEYASSRIAIAGESPSINPRGALVALTNSLVRGEMRDDEVTVVADVFGNGLAQIAEVVEPSRDERAVAELERALQSDPLYAPFVPANMDQRSSATIRVILKIQSVNVDTSLHGSSDRPPRRVRR
jgi:hypothetical protein